MRVNSPGPESSACDTGAADAAGGGGASTGGVARTPSESLWINRVTLPDSTSEGAAGGAGENVGGGSTACGLFCSSRSPLEFREAKRPVTLVEPAPGSTGASPALNSGCRGHLISSAGIAAAGVGGVYAWTRGAAAGAGAEGRGWRICAKPPSADAESEAPEEKPFRRDGLAAGCGTGDDSGIARAGGAGGRSTAGAPDDFTKIRVNSPGADAGICLGSTEGAVGWTAGVFSGTALGA